MLKRIHNGFIYIGAFTGVLLGIASAFMVVFTDTLPWYLRFLGGVIFATMFVEGYNAEKGGDTNSETKTAD
ncbi:hypothetical protein [Paenibacillus illinoisensis]|uniref:hypothetical protein n=1 Tax=Paenibacillus illinoisensis TaxID=59845 RepID=UPI00203D7664|nr:hypothetical protein [Paenibacillus illinoisensis]MCM3205657.1 hypothetical protein [Paenibacillus illinoisensis]